MTQQELFSVLKSTGYQVRYRQFKKGEKTDPSYILYFRTYDSNIAADNRVYHKLKNFQIELYTKDKDILAEETLENAFDNAGIFYNASETYIESEEMYQVVYLIQI